MSLIKQLEEAVAALEPSDYADFRAWFERLDSTRFDAAIAADVADGRLDPLAEQALEEAHRGQARDL